MAKVKKCLDSACTRYILLDDDRVIIEPKDKCWRLEDISNNLQDNKLILEEELVDINEWHKELEDTMDLELNEVKKEYS
jgi:hypothetical protein